jgi:sugar phosphate isomerase/epimerase
MGTQKIPIGVQLYSVREEAARDYAGTLRELADIGYEGIEFYGPRVLPAEELKKQMDGLGMAAIGYHVLFNELRDGLDQVLEYNAVIGSRYIVCPYHEYSGKEDYIEAAAFFSKVGEKCGKAGLQFCYHSHGHEFEKLDGEYGVDILFRNASGEYLQAEMDTHYIKYGGLDPAVYLKKYENRCPLLHLRDVKDGPGVAAAEMGKGILDMRAILKAAEECGVKWLISEEENEGLPAMDSVRNSYHYLKGIYR